MLDRVSQWGFVAIKKYYQRRYLIDIVKSDATSEAIIPSQGSDSYIDYSYSGIIKSMCVHR